MDGDGEEEICGLRRELLRTVAFPMGDPPSGRLITLALMLRTTLEELEREEAEDQLPEFWPLPPTAPADNAKDKTMATGTSSEKVISQGWDEVDESIGSGGAYMKWADGQVHEINICGIPKHIEKDWGDGKGPKKRILIEVYQPGVGCKPWDLAPATWADLKEERKEAEKSKIAFIDAVYAVKRHGSGADTRYKFRYRRQLNAAEANERGVSADTKTVSGDDPF